MSNFSPKNVLVTGGAGFIGSHFVRYLLKNYTDINVVNLDALTYAGDYQNIMDVINCSNHYFVKGNIIDRELVSHIFADHQIDTVVHFAAESHVDRSIVEPGQFVQTNVVGTFTLLEAAKDSWSARYGLDSKQCRFHHISTDEVFGSLTKFAEPFTEQSPYEPNSPYSATKASSDFLVRAYFKTFNLPYTLSNCSNNFGPFQHYEKFIPTIINACLLEKPIPVYGDGSQIRDWLFVEDHCCAIDLIIRKGEVGNSYNIGGKYEISNYDLAVKICLLLNTYYPQEQDYVDLIRFVKDRAGHDWRYAMSTYKIESELGWQPKLSFEENLTTTLLWYIKKHNLLPA